VETLEIILTIISVIFAILSVVFGIGWGTAAKFKKEVEELYNTVKQALKDGKISREEVGRIAEEAYDVIDLLRKVIEKIRR